MKNHSIIFDDFYEDPYAVRNKALLTDFYYRNQLQFDQDNLTDDDRLNLMNNTNYHGCRTVTTNKDTGLITNLKKFQAMHRSGNFIDYKKDDIHQL